MQSRFYQPDEQRAEKVHELFATIARRYDLLNDIMSAGMHRLWKRRLVEMAGREQRTESGEPKQVLDLCCGTGDIALMFARDGACVTGVDFTDEMLQVAEVRGSAGDSPAKGIAGRDSRAGRPRHLFWLRADALRLPFPDDSFDVVSIGYGLRNLADIEAGLHEVLRVLRPGGKLLSLDFGKPGSTLWRSVYFGYLRVVLPILGHIFCGDPDTHGYILASLQEYPAQQGIKSLMESCGYHDCGFEEFVGGAMAVNFGGKPH
jgi:demethylmenaquinone methyltransferase/2-methoxy-6-polyprenyl-1,4-benzoquinol methylase